MNQFFRNIGKIFAIAAVISMPGQYQVIQQGAAWFQMVKDRPSDESMLEALSASVCGQRLCDTCEEIGRLGHPDDDDKRLSLCEMKWKFVDRVSPVLLTPPPAREFSTLYRFSHSDFHTPPPTEPPRQA